MAVYRPPIKCPCCGKQLHFKKQSINRIAKINNVVVVIPGGEYEKCDCNFPFPIVESTLPDDFEKLLNKAT